MSRMFSHLRWWVCAAMVLLSIGCTAVPEGITPVKNFDVQRYAGRWYEIARFDHSFERGMSNVTATYTLREDGGIDVLNRGFIEAEGVWDSAKGKAYFVSDESTGHLKVSFFGPFYASYVIVELDHDDYQYSLVTGPDRDFLWILARQPTLAPDTYEQLIGIAKRNGFNVENLIQVAHDQG